ncbi:MAG: galactitol-1-phosphate 5-dehydrogenase [Deltaproteobacteria bacterium]|jgi:L-iditol 2-dehydrogenase|nr:galactitol-1-phosphate 5-dehydrogenase [Deltaproteobacteria bacterium]
MNAAVLHGKGDIRYERAPAPVPGPGEVLIRVRAAGICGSDVPRVLEGSARFFPIILGHEFSGVIEELGPGAEGLSEGLAPGRRATAAPLVPCMECPDCQRGDYALCGGYRFIGSSLNGAFADLVTVPARGVVTFPDGVPFERAAFFEPATVALHGLLHAGFRPGGDVAVLGAGTVGLFALQWARLLGARRTAAFDVSPDRLKLALRLGADAAFDVTSGTCLEEAMSFSGGRGFGHVFETAGRNSAMSAAFEIAAGKATVCFIGTSSEDLRFGWRLFEKMNRKEFTLTGSWMSYSAPFPGREWAMAADRFGDGGLRFDDALIHRSFPMSEAAEAFGLFAEPAAVKGKIMLVNPE